MILQNILLKEDITPSEFVLALKDFASTCGWTIDSYLEGYGWSEILPSTTPKTYSFQANGSNDIYCQIHSTGYGSQSLTFRFLINDSWSDIRARAFYLSGIISTVRNPDDEDSNHPIWQNRINQYARGTIPENIIRAWFFGNEKFIIFFLESEGGSVEHFFLGTPELFDTTDTESTFIGRWTDYYIATWYESRTYDPVDDLSEWDKETYYKNGIRFLYTNMRAYNGSYSSAYHYRDYRYGLESNTKRIGLAYPIIKPILMTKTDTGLYYEVGFLPVFRMKKQQTMLHGEIVKNGTKKFYIFSPYDPNNWRCGIAVRVE